MPCSDIWRFDRSDWGGEEPGSNIEPGGYRFDIWYWSNRVQTPQNHPQLYFSQLMVPSFSVSQACAGDHPTLNKECRWKCGDVTLTEASGIEVYTCGINSCQTGGIRFDTVAPEIVAFW